MKIVYSIMMALFILIVMAAYIGINEQGARTYTETKSFDTVEEAIAFQANVVREATSIGATITRSDLTVQSPPTVTFRIISPAQEYSILGDTPVPFKYGELWQTKQGAKTSNIIALIIMPLMGIGAIYCIWSKRVQNYLAKQQ